MTKSEYFGLNLPSRDTDDIADINQIARNFEIIDEELYAASAEAGEAAGTAEEARGYAARAYELVGEKAPSIVCQASGDTIMLEDASNCSLQGLKVYGKTTQASTPSPENPQALESPTEVVVKVIGSDVEDQTLAVPILNEVGLAGVPVASGGNYTDANGQQWVCDEVDFARGVYIQRVATWQLPSDDRWQRQEIRETDTTAFFSTSHTPVNVGISYRGSLCNRFIVPIGSNPQSYTKSECVGFHPSQSLSDFFYVRINKSHLETLDVSGFVEWIENNPTTVQYQLDEPIETPLDEETLYYFSALHTNKPNTTILNDSGAWMSAEYVADTKLYIDNKFAELAAAIVSNS